jgi:hypothetical protein
LKCGKLLRAALWVSHNSTASATTTGPLFDYQTALFSVDKKHIDGAVVAEAAEEEPTGPRPFAHAELLAIDATLTGHHLAAYIDA